VALLLRKVFLCYDPGVTHVVSHGYCSIGIPSRVGIPSAYTLVMATNTWLVLSISGNGKLPFGGAYQLSNAVHETHDSIEYAYAMSCPFEGARDAAFDNCSGVLALSQVASYLAYLGA